MFIIKKHSRKNGFALPSVLIASIIMLTVLLAAVVSTAAIRVSLVSQYYNQLANNAGDAGAAYAKACLAANNGVPQWTDVAPLKPNTDCTGTQLAGFTCPTNSVDARCSVAVSGVSKVGVFLVGGGGGGGGGESDPAGDAAGGGGAGGVIYNALFPITLQTYAVTVGGGGAGATGSSLNGAAGNNSVFSTLTAIGGGYGGREDGVGGVGGSGGGGGGSCSAGNHLGGLGTVGQGYSGGTGIQSSCGYRGGGGGGGYAVAGSDDLSTGAGGAAGGGILNSISGATVLYAGGGGGGAARNVGTLGGAGQARGGDGGSSPNGAGTNATTNSGSGGGGAGSGTNVGGAGGSGIVIVSYPTGTITATGGTITTNGGNTIHTFIGSGTFTVTVIPNSSGGVIASFSVPRPQIDSNGKASIIASTGITKLIRQSDNTTWRQYTQNAVAQTNFQGIDIVTNGLVMNLDATNSISYPGSGTIWTDLSGNGNNGTLVGGVGYTSANGGALTFNGVNNYVNVPNSSSILPNTGKISTLSCFKALAVGADGGSIILNKESEYELSAGGGNIDYAFRPNWAWVGATSFDVSQFYCVAVTYDQSYQRMYINGTQVYSAPLSGAIGNSFSNDLRIGARGAPGAASGFFNGQIATVQIYNRALSAAEVQQNFDALEGRYDYQYAKVLVVAGGGGGGSAGGGGSGGVVATSSVIVAEGTSYLANIGTGGSSGSGTVQGGNGKDSSFSSLVAVGGGGGGKSATVGSAGGSGGGGGTNNGIGDVWSGGLGMAGQGYAGGTTTGLGCSPSGGGGGAGAIGGNSISSAGGVGGIGLSSSITGASLYYGGGGGGGGYCVAGSSGGTGGGGAGSNWGVGTNGTANTGGGGGGGATGGSGGSGIVIISYPTDSMTATGGTITYAGGNTIHTFNRSGPFVIGSYQSLLNDPSLIAYYRMEGNSYDSKGSHAGIDTAMTYSVGNGKFGLGGGFNGSTSFIRIPAATDLNDLGSSSSSYTVGVWFKSTISKDQSLSEKWTTTYPWAFRGPNPNVNFGLYDGTNNPTASDISKPWNDGQWNFAVGVRDKSSSKVRLYMNGVLSSEVSDTTSDTRNSGPFEIGSRQGLSCFFNGSIDDFLLFNRALTSLEIANLYNETRQ